MQRDDERVSATGFSTEYWEKSDKKLERRVSIERADLSQVATSLFQLLEYQTGEEGGEM